MRKCGFWLLTGLLAFIPGLTDAQRAAEPDHSTAAVQFNPMTSRGSLIGCEIEFQAILREKRTPSTVWIDGSVSVTTFRPPEIALFLKLVPAEVRRIVAGRPQLVPFNPRYGYAVVGSVSTAGKEARSMTCPSGGFCASYTDPHTIDKVVDGLMAGKLVIGYTRNAGGMDETMPIDFGASGQPPATVIGPFSACLGDFIRDMK